MAMWLCSWHLGFSRLFSRLAAHGEAVWSACDTFWEFDTAHSGAITREVGYFQPGTIGNFRNSKWQWGEWVVQLG